MNNTAPKSIENQEKNNLRIHIKRLIKDGERERGEGEKGE